MAQGFFFGRRCGLGLHMIAIVYTIFAPCLSESVSAEKAKAANMDRKEDNGLPVFGEFILKDAPRVGSLNEECFYGRLECLPERIGGGVEALCGFMLAVEKVSHQQAHEDSDNAPCDGIWHDFPFQFILGLCCGLLMFFVMFHPSSPTPRRR